MVGVPRAVSDDEMTEYPPPKRRRNVDRSTVAIDREMEIDLVLTVTDSLPSRDDVLMKVGWIDRSLFSHMTIGRFLTVVALCVLRSTDDPAKRGTIVC